MSPASNEHCKALYVSMEKNSIDSQVSTGSSHQRVCQVLSRLYFEAFCQDYNGGTVYRLDFKQAKLTCAKQS